MLRYEYITIINMIINNSIYKYDNIILINTIINYTV